jgi:hypothetical protein
MLKDRFLSWKFKNSKESPGEDTISAVKEIENITAIYPQLGYYAFMYRFAPANSKKNQTSDEVFKNLTINGDWYKKAEDMFKNDRIFAYLYNLGYKDNILASKKKTTGKFISDNNISDLMLLYGLFENICEDKTSVRRHYLRYGPQSYLYWFQQNIQLYSFNSTEAKENIERRIKAVKLNENTGIDEMFKGLSSIKEFLKDFWPLFQNNYLLTYLGLRTSKDTSGITTINTDAFFAGDFFGINVPVGYLKTIGI